MESNFGDEYAPVVSAIGITIFVLTWYKRRRLNLPLEPYYNREEQHENYISRIIYGFDEASTVMLRMKKHHSSDCVIY